MLDALGETIPCANYDSWMVYIPEGEFLSRIGPTEFFKVNLLFPSDLIPVMMNCIFFLLTSSLSVYFASTSFSILHVSYIIIVPVHSPSVDKFLEV